MKSIAKIFGVGLMAIVGSVSIAQAAESLPAQKIGRIINYGNSVTLGVTGVTNVDGCTRPGTITFVSFDSTTGAGKQWLAMALTAKASDAEVTIRLNGCISFSTTTVPKVFYIQY